MMNIIKANNLACPIDGKSFAQTNQQLVCENGHTYDIARQGYVNLLPVQYKRSKQPGDSKSMVSARSQFLAAGLYQPIANKLNEIVQAQIINHKDACILDAGCGEGYYFNALVDFLRAKPADTKLSFIGLDISKDAIIHAAKSNKHVSWVVGTNRRPPVLDESVDVILCLFGFLSADGFRKMLKPGGKIILVDPGTDHLKELREIIYPEIKLPRSIDSAQPAVTGFSLLHEESIQFSANITSNEQVNHLLVMTPHFYRASKDGRQAAADLQQLEISVDVVFKVLEKTAV